MSAFAQTPTGDLDISTGNLRVEKSVAQCTAWKLSNLFAFFKGEWFRDRRQGLPYFQYVLIKNPKLPVIGSIFRRVCLMAPGVAAVTEMTLNFNARARSLDALIRAQTDDGAVLVGGVGVPFIVAQKQGDG